MAGFRVKCPVWGGQVRLAWLGMVLGAAALGAARSQGAEKGAAPGKPAPKPKWVSMFDGKKLGEWKILAKDDFEMHGAVEVKDGSIVLERGTSFTGIVRPGKFPTEGFEIELEAMRRVGVDIFCGLTFPVGKSHCTLVLGGWGDSVVGLSSIDDMNASDNEFMQMLSFKNNKWHRVHLRVTKAKVLVWINDKEVLDVPRAEHKFTVYEELKVARPLGFFTWETEGALRKIRYRTLEAKP